ncbi:hypothetical protein RA19_09535 [Leisingera sp. ANG-M1]|nr:hypothetical protein RA19_09535 [Leisingera sp. ANG-M1]
MFSNGVCGFGITGGAGRNRTCLSIVPMQHESIMPPLAEQGFAAGFAQNLPRCRRLLLKCCAGIPILIGSILRADKDFVHE